MQRRRHPCGGSEVIIVVAATSRRLREADRGALRTWPLGVSGYWPHVRRFSAVPSRCTGDRVIEVTKEL